MLLHDAQPEDLLPEEPQVRVGVHAGRHGVEDGEEVRRFADEVVEEERV